MKKTKLNKKRNPIATSPILRKGGVFLKSKTGERSKIKKQLMKFFDSGGGWSGLLERMVLNGGLF